MEENSDAKRLFPKFLCSQLEIEVPAGAQELQFFIFFGTQENWGSGELNRQKRTVKYEYVLPKNIRHPSCEPCACSVSMEKVTVWRHERLQFTAPP